MSEQSLSEEVLPRLREWLDFNLAAGCTLTQIAGTLREAGYRQADIEGFLQTQLSRRAAEQTRLYDADAITSPEEAVQRLWRRFDVLNSFNQISLGDRTVHLLARNIACGILFITDFLSEQECQGLMHHGATSMRSSMVLDEHDGRSLTSSDRSSDGAFIGRGTSELVQRIESRIARLTSIPASHGEALQLLRYGPGGEYRPHCDYFDPATAGGAQQLAHGSQRLVSLIMYLSDVESGGSTLFPELALAFTPLRGGALLFASIDRAGALQPQSLHAGCAVTSGEKWIATKWLRLMPHATTP